MDEEEKLDQTEVLDFGEQDEAVEAEEPSEEDEFSKEEYEPAHVSDAYRQREALVKAIGGKKKDLKAAKKELTELGDPILAEACTKRLAAKKRNMIVTIVTIVVVIVIAAVLAGVLLVAPYAKHKAAYDAHDWDSVGIDYDTFCNSYDQLEEAYKESPSDFKSNYGAKDVDAYLDNAWDYYQQYYGASTDTSSSDSSTTDSSSSSSKDSSSSEAK